MGHRCTFYSKLTLHGDQIVNEVTAIYAPKKGYVKTELVYEEHEDGTNYCRYLYYSSHCGYVVTFPDEKINYYYGCQQKQGYEDLGKCNRLGLWLSWPTRNEDLQEILKARPELKYLIQKYQGYNPTQFIDLVIKYKKNPSIESLVEKDLINIALDNRLEKLSKKKQLEVINFLKNNEHEKLFNIGLSQVLFCIKYKVSVKDLDKYASNKYNYALTNYLIKQKQDKYYYQDYIGMCKELNKNLKDEYWLHPNDLKKAHDKVMEELENKRKIEEALRKKEAQKKREKLLINFEKIGKHFSKLNATIDNFNIYIPHDLSDVENQAKILNQCLITADYPSKVIRKQSILVFVKKDNQPLATAEISYKKKILQFYGDERDRNNCKPSEEVKSAFDQWLSRVSIKDDRNAILANN